MNIDKNCMYCTRDHRVSDLMIEIAELKVTTFFFFKEQTHPGRCIVAYNKGHKGELFELDTQERHDLMDDMAKASEAIQKVFNPDKLNYASFGDKGPHIHFHLVPKYKDEAKWGAIFDMMPEEKKFLEDSQYKTHIEALRKAL
ncbi:MULTISPECIES: HIT family protein [unclassified Oceanispirochaeta]|uniref:HIT family protein n=1 Tax=unclassified Oceanispirochaeta TaxID=2635722 RepID=UPI000E0917CB|nr:MULTISPECIES: HIT domain-containing protein [unclassified Oceanispirochaeta]MBF9018260.1 HIT domain-containing protein [Oceanispirochaeta sp. M2]NPD74701.1 HIT domain-containing protein [Oceanispirochaeta sp. M1]RDG29428.1 HIT domain-containing protein [Oceanispirochaeta sp. M1]